MSLTEILRQTRLRFLPRRLWSRTMLILILPVILLQTVSAIVFYDNHWQSVSRRLALGIASDIRGVLSLYEAFPTAEERILLLGKVRNMMGLSIFFAGPKPAPVRYSPEPTARTSELVPALESIGYPFTIENTPDDRGVLVTFFLPDSTAEVYLPYKHFFSSTTYVFALWALVASLLFTGIAVLFLRNQIRPILRLSEAAKNFGMGRDISGFKPEGATEVRQAAISFLQMRDRIRRHIEERTRMLAGVSHDLRTPLTRMRLQLTMMDGNDENVQDLLADVSEMEHMVNGYLDFARGEGREKIETTDINKLISDTLDSLQCDGTTIEFVSNRPLTTDIRRNDFKRCLWNLVTNAGRYADLIRVTMTADDKMLEISVEDNGPGIPKEKREEVFKAFFRLDESRNSATGGVGLGLTITRDIVLAHGGRIYMDDSSLGGLKVVLIFPI